VDENGGPAAPESIGFIGERGDPDTNLLYLDARWYDPALGRFLTGLVGPDHPRCGHQPLCLCRQRPHQCQRSEWAFVRTIVGAVIGVGALVDMGMAGSVRHSRSGLIAAASTIRERPRLGSAKSDKIRCSNKRSGTLPYLAGRARSHRWQAGLGGVRERLHRDGLAAKRRMTDAAGVRVQREDT
jgi:hypothetical protein